MAARAGASPELTGQAKGQQLICGRVISAAQSALQAGAPEDAAHRFARAGVADREQEGATEAAERRRCQRVRGSPQGLGGRAPAGGAAQLDGAGAHGAENDAREGPRPRARAQGGMTGPTPARRARPPLRPPPAHPRAVGPRRGAVRGVGAQPLDRPPSGAAAVGEADWLMPWHDRPPARASGGTSPRRAGRPAPAPPPARRGASRPAPRRARSDRPSRTAPTR